MVTDVAGLGDKSFNDSAYAGLQAAKRAFGADIEVLESKSAADYQPNLTVLADEDYDQIIAVGFLMSKDLKTIALNYPKRHFAIVDAVVDEPNVSSVVFREQEGAFLAGALAAAFSKTKTIGFLGGVDVPLLRKFEAGYIAGARQVDPSVKVLVKYVGSFEDVPSGKELAGVMYGDGADVIFVAAGKSGLGAIDEARERPGAYAIGVDSDQDALAPGKVLTSMVKHVDVAGLRSRGGSARREAACGHDGVRTRQRRRGTDRLPLYEAARRREDARAAGETRPRHHRRYDRTAEYARSARCVEGRGAGLVTPALVLEDVSLTFPGNVRAVSGVDLTLEPGEIHALVGENGAGKTTLARIAAGALVPTQGTVRAHGRVGLVHQHAELVGPLRVWENVVLGASRGAARFSTRPRHAPRFARSEKPTACRSIPTRSSNGCRLGSRSASSWCANSRANRPC